MEIKPYLDYETILANTHQPIHFALKLTAEAIGSNREQPLAFCVVLDRSGSMQGQPLECAKEAAVLTVRNLRADDLFSLVVFDHEAQTVFPLQMVTDKAALMQQIKSLRAGATTNLAGGWMLGRDELKKAEPGVLRRMLLLSDGHLNTGVRDPVQVASIVGSGLECDQIRTSTLGFGDGYDEDLLANLASSTSGQFYDANDADKLPAVFEAELDGLQKLSAQNIRVRIKPLDFCENLEPLGSAPEVALPDGRREFALGDLVSEEEQVACWAMDGLPIPVVDGEPVVSLEGEGLLDLEIVYDEIRKDGIVSETFGQVIRVKATQDPAQVKANGEVITWTSIQQTGRTLKKATRLMDRRDIDGALTLLNQAIQRLQAIEGVEGLEDAIEPLTRLREAIQHGLYNARTRKTSQFEAAQVMYMKSNSHWSSDVPLPLYRRERQRKRKGSALLENETDSGQQDQ